MIDWDNIRAVTFDAGGTLIEPWPSVGHVYAQVAAQHGVQEIVPETLNQRFAGAWKARRDFNYTRREWAAIVDETFAGLSGPLPSATFFPVLYDHFAKAGAWRIFDDVKPALAALGGRGLRLGVISNWDERLRPLLQRLGLTDHFEVMTVSCEVGCTKPSRGIFDFCAKKLRLAPGQILHVGDNYKEDVEGAEGAGLRGIHLVRNTATSTCEYIRSLAEIAQASR